MLLGTSVGNGGFQLTGNQRVERPRFLQGTHRVCAGDQHAGQAFAPQAGDRQSDGTLRRDFRSAERAADQRLNVIDQSCGGAAGNIRQLPGVAAARQIDRQRHSGGNGGESGTAAKLCLRSLDQVEQCEREVARVAFEGHGGRLTGDARCFGESTLRGEGAQAIQLTIGDDARSGLVRGAEDPVRQIALIA